MTISYQHHVSKSVRAELYVSPSDSGFIQTPNETTH